MYRLCLILAAAAVWVAIGVGVAPASDSGSMDTLSAYLHAHRLPLVEARMITDDRGGRSVMLYGFVATEYGKHDAEDQARDFLDDPDIAVINHIKIRPELLTLGTRANTPAEAPQSADTADTEAPDEPAENAAETQPFPDVIGDRDAYANQERDDELLMSHGAAVGGIPLALAILGSGAIFPPIAPRVVYGPVYRSYPPYLNRPPVYSAPPTVIVIRPSYNPPTAFTGFPSAFRPGAPSPFPAGPAPMFPAAPIQPFGNPAIGPFGGSAFGPPGGFGGGGFGGGFGGSFGRGGFGGHR